MLADLPSAAACLGVDRSILRHDRLPQVSAPADVGPGHRNRRPMRRRRSAAVRADGALGSSRRPRRVVSGILNGIDTDVWDPAEGSADRRALRRVDAVVAADNRIGAAEAFRHQGRPSRDGVLSVVSRLSAGLDAGARGSKILSVGGQLVLLGSGRPWAGRQVPSRRRRPHPGRVGVMIGYDEASSGAGRVGRC